MIDVIRGENEWREQLALVKDSDFYYTYDYHQLSKNDNEEPVLIKYTEKQTSVFIPLLVRNIEGTQYYDATSVYGYAGPLVINLEEKFNKENFHKELNSFFKEHKIITVFSRLHPFIAHQGNILDGLGFITTLGKVVFIDLTDTIENQRVKFSRRLKTYLNKSRRSCTVIKGNLEDHLDTFIRLYHENMERVGAEDEYFFTKDYYHQVLSSSDYESELSLCIHDETQDIIGASMFMKKGDIVQYHLSGLSKDHFHLNPIKLILDEMRIKSANEGYKYFNLGGGLGSKEDSLFKFKSAFSKDFREFNIWKYIVDETTYRKLVIQKFGYNYEDDDSEMGYFPAYRLKEISTTSKV